MTTAHHPTDATLLEYFSGTLDEGRRVVVAAHVEMCSSCRRLLSGMETVAGDYLDAVPPEPTLENLGQPALRRKRKAKHGQDL